MRNDTRTKKIKKFTSKMQAKLLLVFCIIIIAMLVIVGRLVYINRTDGDRYAKRVLSQQTYSNQVIPYQRGSILDRNGTVLATSEKVYNLILDVKNLRSDEKYLKPTISALTQCYDSITSDTIQELITTKPESQYTIITKGLSHDEMMLFKNMAAKDEKIHGVWFEEDYKRQYPYSTLASNVIGFTSNGNVGNWGIEQYYNNELNGTNGREYGYIDSELKVERTIKPAVNGNTIVSTIDANAQGLVQNHIKLFNEEFGSKNIGVLIMNPGNGEIIAMASNEEYDLNKPTDLSAFYTQDEINNMNEDEKLDALNAIWRNFTISDTYEPGSTFKPFTVAASLEEDISHAEDTYYCDGVELVGGWPIKCSSRYGHGQITLSQALQLSCNDAMMKIAALEGKSLFYDYQVFFGFGSKTGIDLPGEANGIIKAKDEILAADLATSSFGQTFTTTMLQLAAGYSSLINGGYYYEPHMVKQILNYQGATVQNIDKILVKETVSKETSDFIKEALYLTVEQGTAKTAKVSGYKVGGKTGTAQKFPRADKKYIVSFVGAVPADSPEIVIYVVIDEPQNVTRQDDSSIATKFASRLLAEVLPFLEIYPTEEVENATPTTVPILPSTETGNGTEGTETEGNSPDENQTNENSESGSNTENENPIASDNEFNGEALPDNYEEGVEGSTVNPPE